MEKILERYCFILVLLVGTLSSGWSQDRIYRTTEGWAYFKSNAPLEVIEARSDELRGILDRNKRTFAFTIPIRSFEGFNSPLQKDHFNENYMESDRFENATFHGKIIEKVDLTKDGKYTIRAKGKLEVHGVTMERIIKNQIEINAGQLTIQSHFSILLKEHNIRIPKIVNQKIAESIEIEVNLKLE